MGGGEHKDKKICNQQDAPNKDWKELGP